VTTRVTRLVNAGFYWWYL